MIYWNNTELSDIKYLDEEGKTLVEVWVSIPNSEDKYYISDLGRIKSVKYRNTSTHTILKQSLSKNGYPYLCLYLKGKKKNPKVHQLVAITFLSHIPCGADLVVDHINNIKYDNRVTNLQLLSTRFNVIKDKMKEGIINNMSWFYAEYDWRPYLTIKNIRYNLKRCNSIEEASKLYHHAVYNWDVNGILPEVHKRYTNYSGVCFYKPSNKWRSKIIINNKSYHIGYFNTEEEAIESKKYVENNIEGFILSKVKNK